MRLGPLRGVYGELAATFHKPQHLVAWRPSDRDRKGITSLSFDSRKALPAPSRLFTGCSRRFALVTPCTRGRALQRTRRGPEKRVSRAGTVAAVRCPFCQENDDKVVDSRAGEDGAAIRRRRECLACG